jgi:hypothetical protein
VTTADAAGNSIIRLPAGGRPKYAPHFAVAGKVGTILGPKGEVLTLAGFKHSGRCRAVDAGLSRPARAWNRKPVVRVGPRPDLFRVFARRLNLGGQRCKLMAAALPDDRERRRVPNQLECQVVRSAAPVTARHRRHAQQGAVHAS